MKYIGMLWGLLLVVVIMRSQPAAAQAPTDSPEAAAQAFYAFLLSAAAEDYPALGQYVCPTFNYMPEEFTAITNARADASVDLSGVRFRVEELSEDETHAVVAISGEVTVASEDGAPIVVLPSSIEMENILGWVACPTSRPLSVISAADQNLSEDDARQAALQFYNAFYTNDQTDLLTYTCIEKQRINTNAANETYGGYVVLPTSQWDFTLQADGYDYLVLTSGTLDLQRVSDGAQITVNDRADFPHARLIRENGWKFCEGYREPERAAVDFARAYFSDFPAEAVANLICRRYREVLYPTAADYNMVVHLVNVPEGLISDPNPTDREVPLKNLQGLVVIGEGEAISAASVFGATAWLVREGNQWAWCQLTLDLAAELEPTPTPPMTNGENDQ